MKRYSAHSLTACAMFSALIIVGAFIRIPGPLVPFTLQVTFVTLSGWILGPEKGALSVAIYIISGLTGLPVFSGGGGPGYILHPNFGYIIGFLLGAALTGLLSRRRQSSFKHLIISGLAGVAVIYTAGTIYFMIINELYLGIHIGIKKLITGCILLTLPSDIILTFAAAGTVKRILPAIKQKNI